MLKAQLQSLKDDQTRFSTEALTFLLGIGIGMLGILPDTDFPYRGTANACLGTSCCFLGPMVAQRMLFEGHDISNSWSRLLEKVYLPLGLIFLMFGTGIVCTGIDRLTGFLVCGVGFGTFMLYIIVTFVCREEKGEGSGKVSSLSNMDIAMHIADSDDEAL